jgi:branched-chain amino acid aminotransferase
MPMFANQVVWIDGKFVPVAEARISVYDHGLLYGDGVFEGIRLYNGRFLKFQTHLRRLWESARSISLDIPFSLEEVEQAVRETAARNKLVDGYVRLVITRGVGPLGVNPRQCPKPGTIIIVDKIEVYPQEKYTQGVGIVTASTRQKDPASLSPRIKSLNYLPNMMAKLEALNAGADEAVMLNQMGFVTECVGENIFAVKYLGGKPVLHTPPVHAGILEGVTMNLAIDLARGLGYEVRREDMTRHDLYIADEIFLTGTGAEIVPVVKIDGHTVGRGKPGECTKSLIAAFRRMTEHAPED